MSEFKTFGSLLQEQDKLGKTHDVLLTPNAGLRATIHRISLSNENIADDNIIELVDSYENMQSDVIEKNMFRPFQAIADAFANKINEGASTLRSIKNEVTELCDGYQEHVAMRIAEDATLAKLCNNTTELSMDSVKWEYLDMVDEYSIRMTLHDTIGMDMDKATNPSMIDMLINKLDNANSYNQANLNKITLPVSVTDRIVNMLNTNILNPQDDVRSMFINILNHDTYACTRAINMVKEFASGKSVANINQILRLATGYKQIFALMTSENLDLAASTMVDVIEHVDSMNKVMNTLLYIASYYRNTVWENAVLVPGPLCNEDNREQYEQKGGSITQLAQHNKRFYDELALPTKGVSGEYILKTAETVEKGFATEAANNIAQLNKTKDNIERGCFLVDAVNYLKNNKPYSNQFAHSNNLDKFAASIYDSMKNSPIESKFYKLILQAKHAGSIVPELYNRIGKAYVEYGTKTGQLSVEACAELDINVYSAMISEYLVDQGIIVVNK